MVGALRVGLHPLGYWVAEARPLILPPAGADHGVMPTAPPALRRRIVSQRRLSAAAAGPDPRLTRKSLARAVAWLLRYPPLLLHGPVEYAVRALWGSAQRQLRASFGVSRRGAGAPHGPHVDPAGAGMAPPPPGDPSTEDAQEEGGVTVTATADPIAPPEPTVELAVEAFDRLGLTPHYRVPRRLDAPIPREPDAPAGVEEEPGSAAGRHAPEIAPDTFPLNVGSEMARRVERWLASASADPEKGLHRQLCRAEAAVAPGVAAIVALINHREGPMVDR